MKTQNKALLSIAAALLVYLLVGLLFVPRGSKQQELSAVDVAATEVKDDSLSYAVALIVARDIPQAMEELGITKEQTDDFVKGICDAFPVDNSSEAIAYARGLVIGATAAEMLEEAEYVISLSDSTKKLSKQMFFDGLRAMATGEGLAMNIREAYDYYNRVVFRIPSDEFMAKNSTRPGVETLPNGVQVKVERAGDGETAVKGSTVAYIYKASYINGNSFDSSRGEVVETTVDGMIPGLAAVFTSMPAGTKCKVYIPWQLGYGAKGNNKVPPYSALVYDIEIVKIVKK